VLYNLFKDDWCLKVNINAYDDYAFRHSCKNGHKEPAEWLYNLSKTDDNTKIDIHTLDEYAFRYSCENGHKDIAEWLYDLSKTDGNTKINININNNWAFEHACINGHKDIAEWLYYLSKIDNNGGFNINQDDDYIFRQSCTNGHLEVTEWLCTLDPSYQIKRDNNGKLVPYIKNIKTFLTNNETDRINEFMETSASFDRTSDTCLICFDDTAIYWILLDCGHELCSNCFTQINRCPMRCKESINLSKIRIICNL